MIRRSLWWALGVASVLSAGALILPRDHVDVVAPTDRAASHPNNGSPPASEQRLPNRRRVEAAEGAPIPVRSLTAASRDPFYPRSAMPPVAVAPVVTPLPPPAPPQAPSFTYRLFGRVRAPDGSVIVYLTNGDRIESITAGTVLDIGYVVDAIKDSEVVLRHPPSGQEVRISIPVQPSS